MSAAAELSAAMLRKRLFVMMRSPKRPEQASTHIESHLRWAIAAEAAGHLFASGPFVAAGVAPGTPGSPAGGLTILRADSIEHACRIADGDPYVQTETVSYEMKEWLLMEGSFGLRINFSSGSYAFD